MRLLITLILLTHIIYANAQKSKPPKKDVKFINTITIGTQIWMAENLNIKTNSSWCYDNQPSLCKKYGRLYDWNTAMNICPVGFHLPSDNEWQQLITFLGGDKIAGIELKSNTDWLYNGNGNNSSGFNALPGGHKNIDNKFFDLGIDCYFWTSNELGGQAVYCGLYNENGKIGRQLSSKNTGMYVRCIKD